MLQKSSLQIPPCQPTDHWVWVEIAWNVTVLHEYLDCLLSECNPTANSYTHTSVTRCTFFSWRFAPFTNRARGRNASSSPCPSLTVPIRLIFYAADSINANSSLPFYQAANWREQDSSHWTLLITHIDKAVPEKLASGVRNWSPAYGTPVTVK